MRARLVVTFLAVVALTGADEPSGGSLETVSGSARIVERAGGLTLTPGAGADVALARTARLRVPR